MSRISERSGKHSTVYQYISWNITNFETVTKWIERAQKIPNFTIETISLVDVEQQDNQNTSAELRGTIEPSIILQELYQRNIGRIYLTGSYHQEPVLIGIVCRGYTISITISNTAKKLIYEMESELQLL